MKNLTIFRSSYGYTPELDKLDGNLSIPGKLGYSWKILREGLPYIRVGDNILLTCELQKKLIPASVVNKELKIRSEKIQQDQDYKIGKKQLRDLKETILNEFYAKAFVTSKFINVWINLTCNFLCIETTSQTIADDVITRLIRDLGYSGNYIETEVMPSELMRKIILADENTAPFSAGRSCVLEDTRDNKSIQYKNEELYTDEIRHYLSNGKAPQKLEIYFKGGSAIFTLDSGMVLSKISIPDIVQQSNDFGTDEDYFDNEFTIRSGQCTKIIMALIETLGEHTSSAKKAA